MREPFAWTTRNTFYSFLYQGYKFTAQFTDQPQSIATPSLLFQESPPSARPTAQLPMWPLFAEDKPWKPCFLTQIGFNILRITIQRIKLLYSSTPRPTGSTSRSHVYMTECREAGESSYWSAGWRSWRTVDTASYGSIVIVMSGILSSLVQPVC